MGSHVKIESNRNGLCARFPGLPCSRLSGIVIVSMLVFSLLASFNVIVANCFFKPCPVIPPAIVQSTEAAEVTEALETTREIAVTKENPLIVGSYENKAVISTAPSPLADEVILNVPIVAQLPELPTGCEATSVTMLLNYAGIDISKFEVVDLMPYSADNPDEGFVGDPYSFNGWTIYPGAFSELIMTKAGSFVNLTGPDLDAIRAKLTQGRPVVCWMSLHGFYVHAVTVTGYDASYFYFNDPWTVEKDAALSIDEFAWAWEDQGFRALSY